MDIFIKNRRGQSVLEYSLLIGVVISALLIMQVFIKRHYQGGLKENAEKMGETFSASGTTTYSKRSLKAGESQVIHEETTTDAKITPFIPTGGGSITGTLDNNALSYSARSGGTSETLQESKTDAVTNEKTNWADLPTTTATDFTLTTQ